MKLKDTCEQPKYLDPFKHFDVCIDYNPNAGLFGFFIRDPETGKSVAQFGYIRCNSIKKIWGCDEYKIDWEYIRKPIKEVCIQCSTYREYWEQKQTHHCARFCKERA
jgi:hypothetical protein